MPNHIHNELIAAPAILDGLAGDETPIDFNKVIPMPEVVSREDTPMQVEEWARFATGHLLVGSLGRQHRHPAESFRDGDYRAAADALAQVNAISSLTKGPFPKDFSDEQFELLIQYMRSLRATGYASWADWAPAHWGTKWNGYSAKRIAPDKLRFQTAWSAPHPVAIELSKRNPAEPIRLRWADEDFGSNAGDVTFLAGEIVDGTGAADDGSPEAHALALELVYGGEIPEDMRQESDGRLTYVEESA